MVKKCEYYVDGMHCKSCEILLEDKIGSHKNVSNVKAKLQHHKIEIEIDQEELNEDTLLLEINKLVGEDGYVICKERLSKKINDQELIIALVIALVLAGIFVGLQKSGVLNALNFTGASLPFAFLIGVVASLSSCMAVVGGLVLSLSASYAKLSKISQMKPLATFHISRIVSFFILGGVMGLLGSAFTLTPELSFIISLVLFFVMIALGLNMLDLPVFSKAQISMPKFITKKLLNLDKFKDTAFYPVVLGAITFFLPCGFTQSMQIYSLTTGNFMLGALTMLVFALGTLPALAAISFVSIKMAKGLQSGLFFKTAGFLVLFFAAFNLVGSLVALGLVPPLFNI